MPDVPEFMRHTEQVKLRLKPEVVATLDKARGDQGRSDWVTHLIIGAARKLGVWPKTGPSVDLTVKKPSKIKGNHS